MTKPCSLAVLRARVNNLLRRSRPAAPVLELPPYVFDFGRMVYTKTGSPWTCPRRSSGCCGCWRSTGGRPSPREQLLDRVWDGGEFVDENALSVAVNRLRRKLGGGPHPHGVRRGLRVGGGLIWTDILCSACSWPGAGVIFGVVQWLRARRQLAQADRMLDRALEGAVSGNHLRRVGPSALEAKLARFLNGSAASARGLAEERGQDRRPHCGHLPPDQDPHRRPAAVLLPAGGEPPPPGAAGAGPGGQAQAEKLRFLIETLVKSSRLEQRGFSSSPPPSTRWLPCWRRRPPSIPERRRRRTSPSRCSPPRAAPGLTKSGLPRPWATWWTMLVKYTPPGGAVTLSAVFYELFCCIQVSDTGPGVPEGEQARIFGRFYRGEGVRDQEGLGLGLFLTRSILTREGGYVKLSSKPGKGSTFSLYLPLE